MYLLNMSFFPRKVLFTDLDRDRDYHMIWSVLIFLGQSGTCRVKPTAHLCLHSWHNQSY